MVFLSYPKEKGEIMNLSLLTYKDCERAACLHKKVFENGWEERIFLEFLQDPLISGIKLDKGGGMCGYIIWREISDEAEVITFVVHPHHQRKGMGSFLMSHLCAVLKERQLSQLFLEVAEDNKAGIDFYHKNGFTFLGKRPRYYPRKRKKYVSALNFCKNLV